MKILLASPPLLPQDHLREVLATQLYQLRDQPHNAIFGEILMQALWKFQSKVLKEIQEGY